MRLVALAVGMSAALVCASAATGDDRPRAPKQGFVAPPAGSYELPVIQGPPAGQVLDLDGVARDFTAYSRGKVTLLSFMYTYCVDPLGCPLAYATLIELRKRLLAQPGMAQSVRFVSLSFDPVNDTPDAMKLYGGHLADPRSALRWHFLTTRSVAELKPMLDDLGQDVSVQLDAAGRPTRVFNHMLKLFLLDAKGRVREIYATAFLMPDVMFNDIQTLLLDRTSLP